MQVRGTYQVCLLAGELPFAMLREALDQSFGDEEAENRIAEKLELLVIVDNGPGSRAGFVGKRAVSQRAAQQLRIGETMGNFDLQRCYIRAHVGGGYFFP